jgi:hypothetical protein
MKQLITAVVLATVAVTAQAKDVAMKQDYLCYAYFDFLEYRGQESNNRNLVRLGNNSKAKLSQRYILKVGGIVDGKKELNFHVGPVHGPTKGKELDQKCFDLIK